MSRGVPIQHPQKVKTRKKDTRVSFSDERPGARKGPNRETWGRVFVGDPDETELGESGELDKPVALLSDAA